MNKKNIFISVASTLIIFLIINLIAYINLSSIHTSNEDSSLLIDNYSISYKKTGSGEPILLLHDFYDTASSFNHIEEGLSKNNTIINIEKIKLDSNYNTGDYSIESLSSVLNDFMKQLGYKSYSIIGNGSGSVIALNISNINNNIENIVLSSFPSKGMVKKNNAFNNIINKTYLLSLLNYSRNFYNKGKIDMNIFEDIYSHHISVSSDYYSNIYNDNHSFDISSSLKSISSNIFMIKTDFSTSEENELYEKLLSINNDNAQIITLHQCGRYPNIEAWKKYH